ncbi:MAG: di-trans,poly-cis-decaprenylcistransferase, partial [Lentisphaeria bacterium]|nr:di-trans,poly-cis-decaprenylcistransferase [Lentisphaeria bacterium]
QRVLDLMNDIHKYRIPFVTLYAFSTENWKRSKEEVDFLMELLVRFLEENAERMLENKIRLRVTGRMEELPPVCVEKLRSVLEKTAVDYEYTLILALNYGGRQELTDAMRSVAEKVKNGTLSPETITEETIAQHLYLPDIPDPDFMIRTSGEERISNFLLWQLSYAEFYFPACYWPDFDSQQFEQAINVYKNRNRRFGGRP